MRKLLTRDLQAKSRAARVDPRSTELNTLTNLTEEPRRLWLSGHAERAARRRNREVERNAMNRKVKALGALFCAALMLGAVSVVSAPAEEGGHFVSGQAHTVLKAGKDPTSPGTPPELHDPILGTVHCPTESLHGTTAATTVTSVTLTATYGTDCTVTGTTNTVHVEMNGCTYTFTVKKASVESTHSTLHLVCPINQTVTLKVTVEHTNTVACIVHIKAQTPGGGITYTNKPGPSGAHTITAHVTATGITVTRTAQFFGGCLFAPEHATNAEFTGTAVVEGSTSGGNPVPITATGTS
jgi:hypothetical protein